MQSYIKYYGDVGSFFTAVIGRNNNKFPLIHVLYAFLQELALHKMHKTSTCSLSGVLGFFFPVEKKEERRAEAAIFLSNFFIVLSEGYTAFYLLF